jgi:ribose/xylose/arabinose/galactoside ABC-type transport system permease subunit
MSDKSGLKKDDTRVRVELNLAFPSVVPLFLLVMILFACASPDFLSMMNVRNILLHCSPLAILSLGMSLVMLTNGIDLSVGSLVSMVGIVTAILLGGGYGGEWGSHYGVLIPAIVGVLAACCCGLFNGIIISTVKLPAFIVTLGTMAITASLSLVLCGGYTQYWHKNWLNEIALTTLLGLPVSFFIVIIIFAIITFLVHCTSFGAYVYGMGSNEEALRLCGVKVNRYKTIVYILNGFLAGVAGIIVTSRIASGNPIIGIGYEFEAIASAAIGGVSFMGGVGHPGFALLAAVTITMLTNGLGLLGYGAPYQYCGMGAIFIVGMFLNRLLNRFMSRNVLG